MLIPINFRVLAVGLKDFVAHGTSQKTVIAKEGFINLRQVPKMQSIVGILRHLGGTHVKQVCESIRGMVRMSLLMLDNDDDKSDVEEDLQVATIPYFLSLASQSTLISDALLNDILQFVNVDVAGRIKIV